MSSAADDGYPVEELTIAGVGDGAVIYLTRAGDGPKHTRMTTITTTVARCDHRIINAGQLVGGEPQP